MADDERPPGDDIPPGEGTPVADGSADAVSLADGSPSRASPGGTADSTRPVGPSADSVDIDYGHIETGEPIGAGRTAAAWSRSAVAVISVGFGSGPD